MLKKTKFNDNFDWQSKVIDKIKLFIQKQKLSYMDAFRSFDLDFDGKISKVDLERALK